MTVRFSLSVLFSHFRPRHGTPVRGHKTKETYPARPGSPTPCKQGLKQGKLKNEKWGQISELEMKSPIVLGFKLGIVPVFHFPFPRFSNIP